MKTLSTTGLSCILLALSCFHAFKYVKLNYRQKNVCSNDIEITSTFTTLLSSYREVFDSVVLKDNLLEVDKVASISGLGHTLYDRKLVHKPRSNIESVIESILVNIQDTTRYVEYWWRDEWINLEAHADVDEILAKTDTSAPLRYPVHGHVLYLQVGHEVRGPTLLFLNNFTLFISVPAVEGRLLRFKGDIVHAVPRPPLAYLDAEEGGTNHELWMRIRRVDGQVSDETTINRRSVLLFNTWDEPPMDIKDTPDDLVLNYLNDSNSSVVQECVCNSFDRWTIQPEQSDNNNNTISSIDGTSQPSSIASSPPMRIKLGLLGDRLRRGRSDRYIELQGLPSSSSSSSVTSVKDALLSDHAIVTVPIQEKQK